MDKVVKYTFSGHESFPCKTLWLKKGYDFVRAEKDFNAPEAVVDLGVGKNMVSAIRYWFKSFGLNVRNTLIFRKKRNPKTMLPIFLIW